MLYAGCLPGSGSRDNAQVRAGLGPRSNVSNQKVYKAFFVPYFFHRENFFPSCVQLILVTQWGSGNESHQLDFLGDVHSFPSQKQIGATP